MSHREAQHELEFAPVPGCRNSDLREGAQICNVKIALGCSPIPPRDAGAVHREDDRQPLEADFLEDLIVGPLEERGVDRHHWLYPAGREPRRERHGMLLRDADIEEPVGETIGEPVEPGPLCHRGHHGHDAGITLRQLNHRVSEDL